MASNLTTIDLRRAKDLADKEARETGFPWIIIYSDKPGGENKNYIACPANEINRTWTGEEWKVVYETENTDKTYQDGYNEGYEMGLKDGASQ